MMQKSLFVKYIFKGKVFLVTFSGGQRDKHFLIGKKLVVGSDPTLFWQIFNDKFPKRYDLIVKEDDKYYLNLLNTFTIEVTKNKQALELSDLKNQGILKDNRLYLSEDIEGKVIVDENTEFVFNHIKLKDGLTEEEKKLIALLHQWPKATQQEKFTKYSMISLILLILILASVVGWTYTPPKKATVFERAEREISIMTELSLKPQTEETLFDYDENYEEVVDDGTGTEITQDDANRQASINARQQERIKGRKSSSKASKGSLYSGVAGGSGAGGSIDASQVGTGSNLAVRARVSGLTGAGSRESGFTNIEVDTGSGYAEIAERARRQKGDQLNAAAISSSGVIASRLGGRKTTSLSASGDVDLGSIASTLGDGNVSVAELRAKNIKIEGIESGEVEVIEAPKINLTNAQKDSHLEEWFTSRLSLQIQQKFNAFKLRKPIKGELTFAFVFRNDIVVSIKVTGRGSIGDKEFTKSLEDIIKGKRCPNIGDYVGRMIENYE